MTATTILSEMQALANPTKAKHLMRFFKTAPGEYAEGDIFLGITVPVIRTLAKDYQGIEWDELRILIQSPYHEVRFCALVILTERFTRTKDLAEKERCYDFYLSQTKFINNWDLVDVSCPKIIGAWLLDKDKTPLYQLAESSNLWEQRIAIVSTLGLIRKGMFDDTLSLVCKLINHPHDLIHKAMGWMLREVGKKNRSLLTDFLMQNITRLPRTTLRYAIEHYPDTERKAFLLQR